MSVIFFVRFHYEGFDRALECKTLENAKEKAFDLHDHGLGPVVIEQWKKVDRKDDEYKIDYLYELRKP